MLTPRAVVCCGGTSTQINYGTAVVTGAGNVQSVTVTGLQMNTEYKFVVVLKDYSFNYGYLTGAPHKTGQETMCLLGGGRK